MSQVDSEHLIVEFQKHWEEDYNIKTEVTLQSVIDKRLKRNSHNEKNVKMEQVRKTSLSSPSVLVSSMTAGWRGFKEDGSLTTMCQVGGHEECNKIIP
jgi:hypothetical protein